MSEETKLVAESRDTKGTSSARNMRREGMFPGIVYDSKAQTASIQLNTHDFEQMLHHHKSEHLIVDLEIDKKAAKKVLLKDVQHHPVSGAILHADFQEISMTEKMTFKVSLSLKGDPVGVTQGGGILDQLIREIEVECLPTDLVEEVAVDVSELKIGESLLVKDIVVDSKLTLITAEEVAVASVAAPRVEEAPSDAEGEEGAEAAEGEAAAEGGEKEKEGEEAAPEEEDKQEDS